MVQQLPRPKDKVEVYWFSEQPNGYVGAEEIEGSDSGACGSPTLTSIRRRPTSSTTSTMSSMPTPMKWVSTES